jgi:3-oxoacyl-[acyl-carrier protein] reductase
MEKTVTAAAIYPSLKGRVVIITGAGQGLGRAYAHHFAAQAAIPVIAEYDGDRGLAVQREIEAAGGQALAIRTDVSDPTSVDDMVKQTLAAFGRIDVLINNAGILQQITLGPFWELPVAEWHRVIAVNLTGVFLCSRAVAPVMQKTRWGRIINVSSSTVISGRTNYLHYIASKSALVGMTRSMARELGPWNITVNVYFPGVTKTEVERPSAKGDYFERAAREQCIQRPAEMSDHARHLLFLCSEDAGFISGAGHQGDGGRQFF